MLGRLGVYEDLKTEDAQLRHDQTGAHQSVFEFPAAAHAYEVRVRAHVIHRACRLRLMRTSQCAPREVENGDLRNVNGVRNEVHAGSTYRPLSFRSPSTILVR